MVPLVWMALSRSEQGNLEFFKRNSYFTFLYLTSRAFQNTIIKYVFIEYFSSYKIPMLRYTARISII